jgi:hypothetical protein
MGVFDDLPATDADVAEVALGDFATLVSRSERLAYGEDGVVAANSFILTSAFPFATHGVEPGHVAVLERHQTSGSRGPVSAPIPGGVMPVASVADGSLTLRRVGYAAGLGAYAGPPGGGIGIRFFVPTLRAQLVTATAEVRRKLGLTASSTLDNADDLRLITVLIALRGLYFSQWRTEKDDIWRAKMLDLDGQIEALMATLADAYGPEIEERAGRSHGPAAGEMDADAAWRVPFIY